MDVRNELGHGVLGGIRFDISIFTTHGQRNRHLRKLHGSVQRESKERLQVTAAADSAFRDGDVADSTEMKVAGVDDFFAACTRHTRQTPDK